MTDASQMFRDQQAGHLAVLRRANVRFFDKGEFAGMSGADMKSANEQPQGPEEMRMPPWRLRCVPMMLKDEFVQYGLQIIEGPILSNLRVEIVASGEEGSQSRVVTSGGKKKGSDPPFGQDGKKPPNGKPFPPKKGDDKPPKPAPGESMAAPFSLQNGEEGARAGLDVLKEKENPEGEEEVDENEVSEEDEIGLNEPTGLPPEVEEYIRDNLNLFIDNCLEPALLCLRYGYAPNEVCYENYDKIQYVHNLESINPFVCDPFVDIFGRFEGIKVVSSGAQTLTLKNVFGYPKAMWFVHRRHIDKWFGESRCRAAWNTFYKKWSRKGYGELIRIWLTKCAFDSGTLYYDDEAAPRINGVVDRDPRKVAIETLNQSMSGSGRVFPSKVDPITGKPKYQYESPKSNDPPQILWESEQDCNNRILLAMGVSPELAHSFATGGTGGVSGRAIPETAFYSTLAGVIKPIIVQDFKEQLMDKLLYVRFGRRFNYRLVVLPLVGDDESSSTDPPPFQPDEVGVDGMEEPFGGGNGKPTPGKKNAASQFASKIGVA